MFKKAIFFFLFLFLISNYNYSQSRKNFEDINKIWFKFYQAFDSLDYQIMGEIHSKKLIRISGGKRISDYKTYINNYKTSFSKTKEKNITNNISLRFFERINNDSIASERGIYKLTRKQPDKKEQIYYGKFHVILMKENNVWKIFMDYDSNENNSIGEKDYVKAHDINELDVFILKAP
ncbi:nuclear transport factor 2 family protein [Tenacibaculum aiptasiae]|uniref:Nuclear transport factor 2 family protein n=1 Tax=Tenacibaculum aiptasiae TaxID=426481 RepID=A0A7J5AIC4_9FLAO|nr:nuclear transport factor 2 family protein [Tenacibaculum aiptasiae]KAB1157334.1 nuclear transport factor 2 family protein [Tenacibaculum aiptasiae]